MVRLLERIINKVLIYMKRLYNLILLRLRIYPEVMNSLNSIQEVIDNNLSVSRFGDGELMIINGSGWGFQKYDENLAKRLKEVLESDHPNIAICIPDVFRDRLRLTIKARTFWHGHIMDNLCYWNKYTNSNKVYLDTQMTRFYMDLLDKTEFPKQAILLLKKIWDKEDILIVEGFGSRLGYQNDMFDNASSVKRILCPAEHAFSKYDQIYEQAVLHSKSKLVLIALGMTATVLAYDLAIHGIRAIDLGHIDIEYEWYKMKAEHKVPVAGRYVNEASSRKVGKVDDEEYLNQILAEVR